MNSPAQRPRITRRAVHGVLLLDKPLGLSSNDALQKAKWLLRAEKAGHTGTLDPLATGLLPLCFGAATKFSQVSLDADKAYEAVLRLGLTTTTGDAEGEVLEQREVAVTAEQIAAALAAMSGEIEQKPPMYSALKHEGRPLYEYARAGIEIERPTRRITIHSIDMLDWQHDILSLRVRCSKGTYIRTLAEDLGKILGCGASLGALRRIGSGPLSVDQAISLDALAALTETEREALLRPPDALLADWPALCLPGDEAARFLTGLRRRVAVADAAHVRVYGPEPHVLLGSAYISAGELIADRLLSAQEVEGLRSEPRFFESVV
ncbi:tRNA pseudouridine(55) synthase TruB [Paucibacter sp. PLA-PC-4]|uniref:tRNA pseudouridine(55) synthase TruB n=1 Tax=Paucibacter sp. PLA-PC-4 TaxID=2993655 RepID=UPI0022497B00|nr:tRNA pseudouridine(55) synthase TruB [Paucibacter sp. PLA-PC-4]MCX2861948.1 tRNA pseudouridine(55) synthase TruB [Paucibacter sp. PLA-PC-4]